MGRRRAAKTPDEPPGFAGQDQFLGVDVSERRDTKGCVADQLGEDAAGAEGDQWTEYGILDEPGQQLGPLGDHRLHDHRGTDFGDGGADGVVVAKIESDVATLGLVGAGGGSLDDHGVTERDGGFDRLIGRVGDRFADERNAVGE